MGPTQTAGGELWMSRSPLESMAGDPDVAVACCRSWKDTRPGQPALPGRLPASHHVDATYGMTGSRILACSSGAPGMPYGIVRTNGSWCAMCEYGEGGGAR